MKPTSQISQQPMQSATRPAGRRNFPQTDYNYQPTVEARGGAPTFKGDAIPELRTFRKISSEFFGAETTRDYVAEALFFVLITAISAWPILSMLTLIAQRMQ